MIKQAFFQRSYTLSTDSGTAVPAFFALATSPNDPMIDSRSSLYQRPFSILAARTILAATAAMDDAPNMKIRSGLILSKNGLLAAAQGIYTPGYFQTGYSENEILVCPVALDTKITDPTDQAAGTTSYGYAAESFNLLQPFAAIGQTENIYLWPYVVYGATQRQHINFSLSAFVTLTVEV